MKKLLLALSAMAILAASATGCTEEIPPPTASVPEKTREISVFYATGNTLMEEKRIIEDGRDAVKTALNEMFEALPEGNPDIAIVQPECKVLGVTVDKDGLATIDFSKEVLEFDAVRKEKVLAFAAINQTLKQFSNVKTFKLQVEGKESGAIDGKDIQKFWGEVSLVGQPFKVQ